MVVLVPPDAKSVIVFQGETVGIHPGVALGALRIGPMLLENLPHGPFNSTPSSIASDGTFGGGGGIFRLKMFSKIHLPRFTGEVRRDDPSGLEVNVRKLACVKIPPRFAGSISTRWNSSPLMPGIP